MKRCANRWIIIDEQRYCVIVPYISPVCCWHGSANWNLIVFPLDLQMRDQVPPEVLAVGLVGSQEARRLGKWEIMSFLFRCFM